MESEVVLALKDVAIELIKIVGPAIVAAFAAYKTAAYQYEQKIIEVEKQNQFNASKLVFEVQKQSIEDINNSYQSLTGSVVELSGLVLHARPEDAESMIKLMEVHAKKLPFALRKTLRDFAKYESKYAEEYSELKEVEKSFNELEPLTTENTIDYALKLEHIYSVLSHCSQVILSEKMNDTLSKYTDKYS